MSLDSDAPQKHNKTKQNKKNSIKLDLKLCLHIIYHLRESNT